MSEGINEELLEDVKKSVPYVAAALIAVAGYYGIRNYRAEQREKAAASLTESITAEEMEEAVANYGGSKTGPALKLKLAKKYFDTARYEEALAVYEELEGNVDEAFADIPVVGKAETLEALGRIDEALQIYDAFAAEKPGNYLALTAKLGSVRCVAKSDKAAALAKLAELKESVKDDEQSKARVEALEEVVTRL